MRIGIAGSGMIARFVLNLWKQYDDIQVTALWCRSNDYEGAKELAKEFGINRLYNDYAAFVADGDFDFVYIGLVNSLHYFYAREALLAKKNVICEKPFTSTGSQAQELLTIARDNQLYLFESILPWYCDNYDAIRSHLDEVGSIKMIECSFSQYSRRYESYLQGTVLPVFNPELDGGALYDLGVYSIHFVMGLVGVPKEVHYFPNKGYNGIDTSGVLIMDYGDFKAVCTTAKDCAAPSRCVIEGNQGCIVVNSHPGEIHKVDLIRNEESPKRLDVVELGEAFAHVYDKILPMVKNGRKEDCYKGIEKVIEVMQVMEKARKEAGIKFSCD